MTSLALVAVAAFPVVFWLNVGKLVRFAALKVGAAANSGAAVEPVKLPKTELAATVAAPVPPFATAAVPVILLAVPVVF